MKCAIYPYSDNLYPIIENSQELIDDICINAVIYPRSWKKLIIHSEPLEAISSGTDFKALIEKSECVIFADVSEKEFMYVDILNKAEISLSVGKDIIFCTKVKDTDVEELRKKYPERNIRLQYGNSINFGVGIYKHEDMKCAILGIGGLLRGLDNVAAVTGLSVQFRKKGLRTVTVTTNATCSLLGFYHFPIEIFSNNLDIEQKTGALNAFFKGLEMKTRCDLMVIQFPDGLMKFMPEVKDSYGVKAFMLSKAISIDYFILVSLLEIGQTEAYEHIRTVLEKRFDLSIDACLIQSVIIDREASEEAQKILYTKNAIEEAYKSFDELVEHEKSSIIAKLDDNSAYVKIVEDCINKLS